jgi:hypothetical protein
MDLCRSLRRQRAMREQRRAHGGNNSSLTLEIYRQAFA